LYSERGDCERKKRKLQRVCCRLYPFICWIIIKEGPGNFSGGCSPHRVNQVYLCLYCIVYLLCFIYAFVLFYCSAHKIIRSRDMVFNEKVMYRDVVGKEIRKGKHKIHSS
jgi:hypothetical protein